jgi:hypothetical protein
VVSSGARMINFKNGEDEDNLSVIINRNDQRKNLNRSNSPPLLKELQELLQVE